VSVAFRQAHRAYGVRLPIEEVPAHLACGWRLADFGDAFLPHDELILRPPRFAALPAPTCYPDGGQVKHAPHVTMRGNAGGLGSVIEPSNVEKPSLLLSMVG
jgi:hypothetical protein